MTALYRPLVVVAALGLASAQCPPGLAGDLCCPSRPASASMPLPAAGCRCALTDWL